MTKFSFGTSLVKLFIVLNSNLDLYIVRGKSSIPGFHIPTFICFLFLGKKIMYTEPEHYDYFEVWTKTVYFSIKHLPVHSLNSAILKLKLSSGVSGTSAVRGPPAYETLITLYYE